MATQEQRKAETRQRLVDAAAVLFAERGIDAVSIDAVAEAADRTSGAVYAHFGGKEGLLTALLESLVNETAALMDAELSIDTDRDEQLAGLWRTFVERPPGPSQAWLLLEHELWLYAARHDEARDHLARRYAEARHRVVESAGAWSDEGRAEPPVPPEQLAPLLVGLLIGLEMQHRIDPEAVPTDTVVAGLKLLTGLDPTERTSAGGAGTDVDT